MLFAANISLPEFDAPSRLTCWTKGWIYGRSSHCPSLKRSTAENIYRWLGISSIASFKQRYKPEGRHGMWKERTPNSFVCFRWSYSSFKGYEVGTNLPYHQGAIYLENHIISTGTGGCEELVNLGRPVLGLMLTQFGATFRSWWVITNRRTVSFPGWLLICSSRSEREHVSDTLPDHL